MILAIGVAAIVLVAVNAVLFGALHLRDATGDAVDAATPVDQAVTFLRRDLQCAVTPTNGTSKVLSGDFQVGNVTSLGVPEPVAIEMFTATGALSDNAPWGDIQRVTYELKQSGGPHRRRQGSGPQRHAESPDRDDAGRGRPAHVERRGEHQVFLLRRLAMGGHLGHHRRDLGEHQSAARRPRGHPDGRQRQRDAGAD